MVFEPLKKFDTDLSEKREAVKVYLE